MEGWKRSRKGEVKKSFLKKKALKIDTDINSPVQFEIKAEDIPIRQFKQNSQNEIRADDLSIAHPT